MPAVMRAWRALGSAFVDDGLYRRALGGGRADVTTVMRYLRTPIAERPLLSFYFDAFFYSAARPRGRPSPPAHRCGRSCR